MRKARVTACDNFFSTDKEKRCNGRYCDGCIQRHYLEDATDFALLPQWICFRCTGRCTCAACKRRRKGCAKENDSFCVAKRRKEEKKRKNLFRLRC